MTYANCIFIIQCPSRSSHPVYIAFTLDLALEIIYTCDVNSVLLPSPRHMPKSQSAENPGRAENATWELAELQEELLKEGIDVVIETAWSDIDEIFATKCTHWGSKCGSCSNSQHYSGKLKPGQKQSWFW